MITFLGMFCKMLWKKICDADPTSSMLRYFYSYFKQDIIFYSITRHLTAYVQHFRGKITIHLHQSKLAFGTCVRNHARISRGNKPRQLYVQENVLSWCTTQKENIKGVLQYKLYSFGITYFCGENFSGNIYKIFYWTFLGNEIMQQNSMQDAKWN